MAHLIQLLVTALLVGGLYGLVALAYVLVHAVTGRFNLAMGALTAWAGHLTIGTALALMLALPGRDALPSALALAGAVLGTLALVVVLERWALAPVSKGARLATLVVSLGLAIALEEIMRLLGAGREVWLHPVLDHAPFSAGAEALAGGLSPARLLVIAATWGLAGLVALTIARHPFGRAWRAVAQDDTMAALVGIDVGRTRRLTWLLAAGLVAFAGALSALYYGLASFHDGLIVGLKALLLAIVGGVGSLAGPLGCALGLGLLETLWSGYLSSSTRDVAALLALSGLMISRPEGLFAEPHRRDAGP